MFWAIRGGGGNFGVVTKFRFRMHSLGPVTVGRWFYPTSEAGVVLQRYSDFLVNTPRELTTLFSMTPAELKIAALWSGSPNDAESMMKGLSDLGTVIDAAVGGLSFLELQKLSDEHARWGRRVYAKGGFLQTIDEHTVEILRHGMATAPVPGAEVYMLQLGGAVCDMDDNATSYTGRAAGHYWIVTPYWDNREEDERCISWGRKTAAQLTARSMTGNYVNEQ